MNQEIHTNKGHTEVKLRNESEIQETTVIAKRNRLEKNVQDDKVAREVTR